MSRLQAAMRAALEVNGIVLDRPVAPSTHAVARQPDAPAVKKPRTRTAPADVVLALGPCGVLVRTRDGRLPREGDLSPDGACLRVRHGRGHVLVASSLRASPSVPCAWVPVSRLRPVDLEIVRAVAPAHLDDLLRRDRVAKIAREVADLLGVDATDDAEAELSAVRDVLVRRLGREVHVAGATALDFPSTDRTLSA